MSLPQHPDQRTKIATCRTLLTAYVTTSVMRDQYEDFEKRSHAAGLTKSAMLRKLIEDYLRG